MKPTGLVITIAPIFAIASAVLTSACSNHPIDTFHERAEIRQQKWDRRLHNWSEKQDRKADERFDRIMGKTKDDFEF